jgi:transposase-like protein
VVGWSIDASPTAALVTNSAKAWAQHPPESRGDLRRGYPPEFRRKVLDLVGAGRPIAEVAQALGISDQSIYTWRRQDRIDRGLEPALTSAEKAELAGAKRRIAELETELHATRCAIELLREVVPPKRRFEAVTLMAAEAIPVEVACRVVGVRPTSPSASSRTARRHGRWPTTTPDRIPDGRAHRRSRHDRSGSRQIASSRSSGRAAARVQPDGDMRRVEQ